MNPFIEVTESILNRVNFTYYDDENFFAKSNFVLTDSNLKSLYEYSPIGPESDFKVIVQEDLAKNNAFLMAKLRNTISSYNQNAPLYSSIAAPIHKTNGEVIGFIGLIIIGNIGKIFNLFVDIISKWISSEIKQFFPEAVKVPLNEKEAQIIQLISNGKKDYEISEIIHLSRSSVRVHIQNLFSKYNVKNRSELVAKYLGMID